MTKLDLATKILNEATDGEKKGILWEWDAECKITFGYASPNWLELISFKTRQLKIKDFDISGIHTTVEMKIINFLVYMMENYPEEFI